MSILEKYLRVIYITYIKKVTMKTSDKILTFTALFISCLALIVSIVQTKILQKQSQASVWPRVDLLDSSSPEHFRLSVSNQGVGPAIISHIEYTYKDTSFYSLPKLVTHLGTIKAKEDKRKNEQIPLDFTYAEIIPGRVIKPEESIDIYNALDSFAVSLGRQYLYDVKFQIDYCSIYNDCWRMMDHEVKELN